MIPASLEFIRFLSTSAFAIDFGISPGAAGEGRTRYKQNGQERLNVQVIGGCYAMGVPADEVARLSDDEISLTQGGAKRRFGELAHGPMRKYMQFDGADGGVWRLQFEENNEFPRVRLSAPAKLVRSRCGGRGRVANCAPQQLVGLPRFCGHL